jgi:drug/metabolite transporter (DMT)-like permease
MAAAGEKAINPAVRQGAEKSVLPAAYGAAAFAMLIWGGTPTAVRLAVDGIDPLTAGILRTVLAAIVVLPLAFVLGLPRPRGMTQWALLVASGAGVFIGFPLLFSVGIKQTSVSHASLINAAIPLFTGLFGAIAERKIPGRWWLIGVTIALAGEGLLIGFRDVGSDGVTLRGDLLCLASSICSGFGYVTGARLSLKIGSRASIFWGISVAGIIQLPLLYALWGTTDWSMVPATSIGAVMYMASFSTVIAFIAWYWALNKAGIVRMAPVQFSMPLISLTLAVVVFNENLSLPIILSGVIILSGIAIARKE